jgi:dTDP-glucose pyrophosphorylase
VIIIPAAGHGRRFQEAGFFVPKPDIPLGGRKMIERVAENVEWLDPDGELVIATQDVVGPTSGAVETIHRALQMHPLKPFEQLVIANCDQLIRWQGDEHTYLAQSPSLSAAVGDGWLATFPSQEEAHSYVMTDSFGRIRAIVEKQVVSTMAVSGVYAFRSALRVKDALEQVLSRPTGSELYLSSAIELLLYEGMTLYSAPRPTAILGTPEDVQRFDVAYQIAAAEVCHDRGVC